MVDQELVDILVCPETKQAVRLASPELLQEVNAAIASDAVRNRGGDAVSEPLEAGLVREDDAVLYPIREDIPIMLLDESIPLEKLHLDTR